MNIRSILLLAATVFASSNALAADPGNAAPIVQAGIVRQLHSTILQEDRTVLIRLPAKYDLDQQRYPVLYKLDGDRSVFPQTVGAVEYVSDWEQAPDYIVIGIQNTGRDRDMLPERGAAAFLRFLKDELVPFIDASYRTSGSRVLCGQSLSSVFAGYTLVHAPGVFDGIVLSSFGLSAEWQRQFESDLSRNALVTARPCRVFVANARNDAYDRDGTRTKNGLSFLATLQKAAGPGVTVTTRVFEDEGHVPFPSIRQGLAWINTASTSAGGGTPEVAAEPLPGTTDVWQLSPTARPFTIGLETYLDGRKATEIEWLPATAGVDGWIDIAGVRSPNREGGSKVWARTTITVASAESRPYAVSARGELSLYLNGRPVLRHNRRSAGASPRDAQDTVFLPLVAGENELAVMVTAESAADWRFQVRDATVIRQDAQLTTVWEQRDAAFGGPESVAYDAKRGVLYVSSFSSGALAKLSLTGEVLAADWVPGMKRPTGVKLHGERLYAVDRSGLVIIDPASGVVTERIAIADAGFANDLAIAADGTVYITDSSNGGIYRVSGGKSEVWIAGADLAQPNGILVEQARLLVGVTSDCTIKAIDLATKKISPFVQISSGAIMDGLVSDGGSGYLFSDYFGRLYHADAVGKLELLLDRRSPQQFIADFEYVPSERLLIVPSLYDQRITALRWTPTLSPAAKE